MRISDWSSDVCSSDLQPRDHAALAVAEIGLAEPLEDVGNRHARGRFDLGVGIDERQTEPGREPFAHGRLAHAHQSDEHDRLALPGLFSGPALHHRGRGYTAWPSLGPKAVRLRLFRFVLRSEERRGGKEWVSTFKFRCLA